MACPHNDTVCDNHAILFLGGIWKKAIYVITYSVSHRPTPTWHTHMYSCTWGHAHETGRHTLKCEQWEYVSVAFWVRILLHSVCISQIFNYEHLLLLICN